MDGDCDPYLLDLAPDQEYVEMLRSLAWILSERKAPSSGKDDSLLHAASVICRHTVSAQHVDGAKRYKAGEMSWIQP